MEGERAAAKSKTSWVKWGWWGVFKQESANRHVNTRECNHGGFGCSVLHHQNSKGVWSFSCQFPFLWAGIPGCAGWTQLPLLIDLSRSSVNAPRCDCTRRSRNHVVVPFWKWKLSSSAFISARRLFSLPPLRFPVLGGFVLLSWLFQASFSLRLSLFDLMASITCSFCVDPQFTGQSEGHRLAQPRGWAILTPDPHTARVQCVK